MKLSVTQKLFDSEPKRREADNEMLQKCYSCVKRWLKVLHGQVAEYRLGRAIRAKVLVFNVLLSSFSSVVLAQSQSQRLSGQRSTNYRLEFAASALGRSQLGAGA